jgi:serine/threonine protein kinase
MAPEQACGDTDAIDERTDTYSLAVVCYELLTLRHYLPGHVTVGDMIAAVITKPHVHPGKVSSPHQPQVPAELAWFVHNGLAKDPAARYQTTGEMLDALLRAMSGSFRAQCLVTLMKRGGATTLRFVDAHPMRALAAAAFVTASALLGLASLVTWIVR